MNCSGASFSIATTVFVSLAICAVISYGVFYYFKQRLSVIEQSQMEQARVMQAIITRGIQAQVQAQAQHLQSEPGPPLTCPKEITITQNGLIEVSSDSDSESDSESESESSESDSESKSDKWSIGDEIHQPDSIYEWYNEKTKKHIHIDPPVENLEHVDPHVIEVGEGEGKEDANQTKKIISLNRSVLMNGVDDNDDNDDDDDSSSSDEPEPAAHTEVQDFELKISYKSPQHNEIATKAMHLNYGNMSVPALRQLAKERGLVGDDGELQKLKKKDLVALLQWMR